MTSVYQWKALYIQIPFVNTERLSNCCPDQTCQEKPLTGFLSRVGLASGVREGIQKLGRLWLDVEAEAAVEDSAELLSVVPFSLPLFCPEVEKQLVSTVLKLQVHLL